MHKVTQAGVAELVDAQDSKSCMGDHVRVRSPLPAPIGLTEPVEQSSTRAQV
jgi:hypothetical protein